MLENAAHPTPATIRAASAAAPTFAGVFGMRRLIARRTPPRLPEKGISLRIAAPYDKEEPCGRVWHANLADSLSRRRPTPVVFLPISRGRHAKSLAPPRKTAAFSAQTPAVFPQNPRYSSLQNADLRRHAPRVRAFLK